jgi:hypothetical protein
MIEDMLLVFFVLCFDEICLQDYSKKSEKNSEYAIILVQDIEAVMNIEFFQLEHD